MKKKLAKKKNGILTEKNIKILRFLKSRPEGARASTIAKVLNLPTRTAYNNLKKLEKKGFLKNIYPIWRLCHNQIPLEFWQSTLTSSKQQGHKFSFVLPLVNKPSWWNRRKDRLIKLKEWHYKRDVKWGNNKYEQITKDSMQIQTYRNSIFFINQKEYFGDNPYSLFNQAKDDVLEAIRFMEEKFRFKFLAEGNEHLTVITDHFVNIQDALSKHCKKTNNRFLIKTPEGYSLWVDFSEPFGTETDNPEVMRLYLKDVKDRITHPTLPVASEIWQLASQNTQNQAKNTNAINVILQHQRQLPSVLNKLEQQIQSHLALIKEYRKENITWRKEKIKEIKKEVRKENSQKSLKEFGIK